MVLAAESPHIEVMRLLMLLAPAVALVLDDSSQVGVSSSRPVSKVVTLLQGMKENLESEASEEAELMEKYNCWCKENGEAKEKAILEATSRIEEWETRITQLSALSSRLETETKNLQDEVDKNEASLDESMALRKKEVAKFQEEEKELFNSLNSVKSAEEVLNSSSFLQRPAVHKLQMLARHADRLSDHAAKQLTAFLQGPGTGSVKGVLDGLETDFASSLKELHDTEKQNKAAYEKLIAAKRDEIDSAKVQIQTKKEEKTAADEERLQKKQDVKDAKGSKDEDLAFAKEVQEKCAAKEKAWEKRQETRADEMQAVSKAIEVLDSDSSHELFGKTMKPSLLQLATKEEPSQTRRSNLYSRLRAAGKAQKDLRLVTLSLEAKLDSFTEVQEKIDTMVAALKKEQANEVKKKDYCIEELNKNKMASDGKKRKGEGLDAAVEELKQKLKAIEVESKELEAEVEELKKQQKLAAQNREKENAEFQKVVQEQRQTQVLLKKAMQVLAGFYNKPLESFLQEDPKEPETFGSYKKAGAGNGVMMMLQHLIADAKEMEMESSAAEGEAQKDYEIFGKETIASLSTKNKALEDKAATKAKIEEKFVMTRQSKKGVEKEVDTLAETEVQLHETCDFTLQNFDARQKARSEEVESLFDAKAFLKGAK